MRITDSQNNTVWAFTWYNGKLVNVTNAAGEEFEPITNYRGDVVQLVDAAGETVASYEYDPWGNLLSKEPTDPRIQGQPIRYAGYVYDAETKLYYLQARYYDPATARFISRDPDTGDEDDPITMNGYTYADGNPVMMVDADGNMAHLVVYYAIVGGRTLYVSYKAYKVLKKAGKVTRVVRAPKVIKGKVNNKVFWGSWSDYKKVKVNGQTYAKVGDRLYSKHAVDRMQPSGKRYGSPITQAGGDYGRSVSPTFVESVIRNTRPVLQQNGNLSYTSGSLQVITNKQGAVVTIITK